MGAVIKVGGDYSIDMTSFDFYVGDIGSAEITSFTSTTISGYVNGTTVTVRGAGFKADSYGYLVSGTVNGISAVEGGETVASISGVSVSVQKIVNLIENGTASSVRSFVVSILNGNDSITGGIWDDFLYGYAGDDKLYGRGEADRLNGGIGKDMLDGGSGNDRLIGGDGNDSLYGSTGADRINGDAGADLFVFKSVKDSAVSSLGRDTINDFSRTQGDKIDLKAIDASTKLGGDQAFKFIGSQAFHKTAGELRYEIKSGDTFVLGDINGDGSADFSIMLDRSLAMLKSDFIL
jgi:Ca2+-binding RTX toxin-like protein